MSSPAQAVRTGVAHAARLQRARATSGRLWRTAPVAAAICAILAAGVRWGVWPALLPIAVGAAAAIALAAWSYVSRRDRGISDATAADLDEAASLRGELRSASWFAARDAQSEWVEYHVARAARRLEAVDWAQLYPPVRAHREKALTALLAIAAIILVLPAAGQSGVHATESGSGVRGIAGQPLPASVLPPELRKKLEEMLKAAEEGSAANGGRALTEQEIRDLLARLEQSPELKNAKEAKRLGGDAAKQMEQATKELKALADRAKKASELGSLSPQVRDALSDVADKLADTSETEPTSPKDPSEAAAAADARTGDAAQSNKSGEKQEASIQAVKDASAGGGVGVVMMSSDDPSGAQEAGLGLGGGSSDRNGGGKMPDLAALRKETIEAYKDDEGEKTPTDLRRKTEHGTASVGYSATSPAAFDKGRATAPPAVPENRRTAVQTYFIRKQ